MQMPEALVGADGSESERSMVRSLYILLFFLFHGMIRPMEQIGRASFNRATDLLPVEKE